jgi:hypothetical protein
MARLFGRQASEKDRRDELLSAYLDGQLSVEERMRLEARLAADPALQAELETLRHTVTLVRGLPQVEVPRNFILPRAAVAQPRPARPSRPRLAWAAPFLTAATAATSLLFVLVLAGNLMMTSYRAFAPASAPVPEAEAPQMAMEPSPDSQEVVGGDADGEPGYAATPRSGSPPLPTEAPVEEPSRVEAEGEYDEASPTPEPAPPAENGSAPPAAPTATMTAEEWLGMTETAPGEGTEVAPAAGGGTPAEETEDDATGAPTATPAVPPAATPMTEMHRDKGTPEPTPGAVAEASPPTVGGEGIVEDRQAEPADERGGLSWVTPWLVLEAALGLITLGLALVTILAWRARRR